MPKTLYRINKDFIYATSKTEAYTNYKIKHNRKIRRAK